MSQGIWTNKEVTEGYNRTKEISLRTGSAASVFFELVGCEEEGQTDIRVVCFRVSLQHFPVFVSAPDSTADYNKHKSIQINISDCN